MCRKFAWKYVFEGCIAWRANPIVHVCIVLSFCKDMVHTGGHSVFIDLKQKLGDITFGCLLCTFVQTCILNSTPLLRKTDQTSDFLISVVLACGGWFARDDSRKRYDCEERDNIFWACQAKPILG